MTLHRLRRRMMFARKTSHLLINPLTNPSIIPISDSVIAPTFSHSVLAASTMVRPSQIAEIETNREITAAASRCHFQTTEISSRVFKYTSGEHRALEQNLIKQ
eukprot:Blabericola_migrator_1__2142@NODE_1591_length_4215_cov_90_581003_g364_i3_p6_GENE_NODE_1591_length_4215_cov_90_581003_g364_i3NODE_1591_length_4215_cov_90_581003_g364_i3_p6_ORF_typecomplete_len103_score6_33_NODE_1591_length_4215_cov_90_581003_g364_i314011709